MRFANHRTAERRDREAGTLRCRASRLPTFGAPYRRGRPHPIGDATRQPQAISRDIAYRASRCGEAFEMPLQDRRYKVRKSAGATRLRLIAAVWATPRRWLLAGGCFTNNGCNQVPTRGVRSCRFEPGTLKGAPWQGKSKSRPPACVTTSLTDGNGSGNSGPAGMSADCLVATSTGIARASGRK